MARTGHRVSKRPAQGELLEQPAERELLPVRSKTSGPALALSAAETPRVHFDLPGWAPESKEPTYLGNPCSHYRRDFPPFRGCQKYAEVHQTVTSDQLYALAPTILQSWMALRPGLVERLGVPLIRPYP